MEIREEYRVKVERELTPHEERLWTFNIRADDPPDVLAIKEPTQEKLYQHSQIDEEKEGFYKMTDTNYFVKKYKKQIEKEQTWGLFLTPEGMVRVKPLERNFYWAANEFIKKNFIPVDPLWSWFHFDEEEAAYKDILRIIKIWITSDQSVVAVNPKTKKLHGVALGRYNDGTYISKKISQVQVFNDQVFKLMNIRRFFVKRLTAQLKYFNKPYYQIHVISNDDSFPEKQVPGLIRGLIQGCVGVAKTLNVDFVFGLSAQKIQDEAFAESGFVQITSCPLYSWLTDDEHIAVFRKHDYCPSINVYIKDMVSDPNLKWKYYRKLEDKIN